MSEKKRITIGYIFSEKKLSKDEEIFIKLAKKKNVKLILFNLLELIDDNKLLRNARKCDIVYNNSAEEPAIEIVKTIESIGKRVVDSSKSYYYIEDKWMFYLICKKAEIPTLKTNLLSNNLNLARKEMTQLAWPVVLKRVEGTCGEYVDKADSKKQAIAIIRKFIKKSGRGKVPIIAQEFVSSPSYRVTVINKKIMQAIIKDNRRGWKSTGVYEKKFKNFKIDSNLRGIINRLMKIIDIKVCGVDLVKSGGKWKVLEVNSTPAFDFIEEEREKLIEEVFNLLIKEVNKKI